MRVFLFICCFSLISCKLPHWAEEPEKPKTEDKDKDRNPDEPASPPGDNPQPDPQPQPDPNKAIVKKMALLGDSIGAGFLSDSEKGKVANPSSLSFSFFTDFLSSGFDLSATLTTYNPRYKKEIESAFVGKLDGPQCFSVACRLGIKDDKATSHAVVGHHIEDLLRDQLPNLDKATDFVITEIGANNFCDTKYNQASFLAQYKTLLDELSKSPASVLIVPLPDVPGVFQKADSYSTATQVSLLGINQPITCGQIRDGFSSGDPNDVFCPRILDLATKNKLADARTEIKSVNDELEALVSSYNLPKRFFFAKGVATWELQTGDLAADCFHPNRSAHKKIADISWDAVKEHIQAAK